MKPTGHYYPPARQNVYYGRELKETLLEICRAKDAQNILFVTNSSLSGSDLSEKILVVLNNFSLYKLMGLKAHSPQSDVQRVNKAIRKNSIDLVVAFGGGSVCDTAKVACLAHANNLNEHDYNLLKSPEQLKSPKVPFVAIPTTLSAGEFTSFAGITDEAIPRKEVFWHPGIAPETVILDPLMTTETPDALFFSTGIRAVDHAIETWCSVNVTPPSEALALHALRMLASALPVAKRNTSLESRLNCQIGSWLSVQGVSTGVDLGASHGIGHVLGGTAGMPHGETSCVMLPHVLSFNFEVNKARQKSLAEAMGKPDEPLSNLVKNLVATLSLPYRLRDAGVPENLLETIAQESMLDHWISTNPKPIKDSSVILSLLKRAW
ncbi:MAG: iron-containing alcohol dehydrogenase [Pseudomonadota bacterium]|nr:iron-containing alcohol dehydrogenase [Pseudomonadota bacterium]